MKYLSIDIERDRLHAKGNHDGAFENYIAKALGFRRWLLVGEELAELPL